MQEFLELINRYPSPHNGQPIRLKQTSNEAFELYFDKSRGLQAADISFIFSFVSMGVFVEHMRLCAQALGHGFIYTSLLPSEKELHGNGTILFARCRVDWNGAKKDMRLQQTLRFRQTSRKKYYEGPSVELVDCIQRIASDNRMRLSELDAAQAVQAIWLNQRAVFDDLRDEPLRRELDHWLRYTQAEKQHKKDGLAYDCMELNGRFMKYTVDHPGILRAPGISQFLKQYYLRTMKDASSVFYMMAPFGSEQNAFDVGMVIMKIWKEVAEAGDYLHPFGTIMSNHAAHGDFLRLIGEDHESRERSYLVFIFRCGKSKPPIPSLRLPYTEHLIME